MTARPLSGGSRPVSILIVVDLPAPLSPSRANTPRAGPWGSGLGPPAPPANSLVRPKVWITALTTVSPRAEGCEVPCSIKDGGTVLLVAVPPAGELLQQ